MPSEQTPASQSQFERDEDFLPVYANNVLFEPSVWDLKMIFGQLDQSEGKAVVEQHTAVTIPWAQAKVLSYYLQVNLTAYASALAKNDPPLLAKADPGILI